MITRQRIVSYGIPTLAAGTIVAAALLTHGTQSLVTKDPITKIEPSAQEQIDVVFALDTTGSMGGLLDGAKQSLFTIARSIRSQHPNADLRIGLVAYKDVGDEYVTKPYALTSDLDAVYAEIAGYTASGGGDTPEDVDAALDDTLHKMQWRDGAEKLVFVVGDAPPASRGEVPTYDRSAREAAERGIVINTVRCGFDGTTESTFTRIAQLGRGEFFTVQQDGGVQQQIATPYDAQLADLANEMDGTVMVYGGEGAAERYRGKMAASKAMAAPAKADRASYYAKGGLKRGDDDLVGGVASGAVAIESVPDAEMPADLRGMDKDEAKKVIETKAAKRRELQEKTADLAKKRDEYLSSHGPAEGEGGFDTKVKQALDRQLKK